MSADYPNNAASIKPDFDSIAALDFIPPCERKLLDENGGCDMPAEWVIVFWHHCKKGIVKSQFRCDEHLRTVMDGAPARCMACDSSTTIRPRIIRTERISS